MSRQSLTVLTVAGWLALADAAAADTILEKSGPDPFGFTKDGLNPRRRAAHL